MESGDRQGALDILAGTPADKAEAEPIVALRTRIALSDEAAALGDAAELQSRLAADPKDHDARFDLALVRNAEGDREAAAEALLAIVKADRSWRDDGARAQLLKFFEAWGPGMPLSPHRGSVAQDAVPAMPDDAFRRRPRRGTRR